MCVLINFILGGEFVSTTEKKTTFTLKKPGACHHARFMGKALYLLKIYILSLIYNRLTSRQLISLERMVLFILALYGKYFLQSSLTVAAPKLDMVFINNLNMFKNIDIGIANCVLQSAKRHLWYLTPELIPLLVSFLIKMSALKPNNKLQESSHRSVSLKIFKVGNLHSPKSST